MKLPLFILDHPTRGVVTDVPGDRDDRYHFSWSRGYSDESTKVFSSIEDAKTHQYQASLQVGPTHTIVVRQWGTWEAVA